ncbi:MAG: ThuA domain-containing protein [Planctomycetes bacterium]|nr:ThuA domain-containing protein [Planctomycetota bacterium]
MRTIATLLALFVAVSSPSAGQHSADATLRVLFLGDHGHHEPALRAQQVLADMRRRGVDLDYTATLESLTLANLQRYDALLIYANHDRGPAERVQAIVDYVERGGALVAVHCASYCFIDSAPYVALVGGQFESHGTGVFRESFTAPQHPLLSTLAPLESWDETYVHSRHAADREVLAVRTDEHGSEPYTWTRTQGQGRVFYTAWGHDERTWGQAGFRDLLERGIRWAVSDEALARPRPTSEFTFRAATVPHYEPSGPSAAQAQMQEPLSPARSAAHIVVPPELEARLFASEPFLAKPLCMTFDERGRMIVGESYDYPNDLHRGRDRVVILEDRDRDGRCDSYTTFADGLSIPTSLCSSRGGLIAICPPDVLFLRDVDGDDRADERQVLFSGWGTGDTHATASNLRYGFDGWIWGTVGYSGFRGRVGGEERSFLDSIYRFKPDGSALEVMGSTSNNTWGLGFSEDGAVFASTANGNPSVHLALAHRFYEAVDGASPGVLATIADGMRIHPITSGVRQVDWHGLFTAAAGHALYTARSFPRDYWNRAAFVCEPTGHVVARFFVEPSGAGFVARESWNLLASDDEWTAPIAAEVGPDGCVWVLDWYNYIVQHNPTPPGFDNGPGNAYVTALRDKTHGRIYRVQPRGFRPQAYPRLDAHDAAGLVSALRSDNLLWRLHAQRMLVERGSRDVVDGLVALLDEAQRDALGLELGSIHALHTLQQLNALAEPGVFAAFERALSRGAPEVSRTALAMLPAGRAWAEHPALLGALAADDARVRLAALLAAAELPESRALGARLGALLEDARVVDDPLLCDALMFAGARHSDGFLQAVLDSSVARRSTSASATATQLLPNVGFEELARADRPQGWLVRHYSGEAEHRVAAGGRTGNAISISSSTGADSSYCAQAKLDPDATYRLSGWIKTVGLDASKAYGACLNVHEIQGAVNARTAPVSGSSDWTRVEVRFDADGRDEVTINCLFGGWGWARGTAWFDDVRLELVDNPGLPGAVGKIVSRVTRHYARQGGSHDVATLIERLPKASEGLAHSLLAGLVDGWPQSAPPELDGEAAARIERAARALASAPRERLVELLAARWGLRERFAGLCADVVAELRGRLGDAALEVSARVAAAQRLVALDSDGSAVLDVLDVLTLDSELELAVGCVEALGESRGERLGEVLVEQWSRLTPAAQRAAVRVLRRRTQWTAALLAAIERDAIPSGVVEPAIWQELSQHPDHALAATATRVRRKGAPEPQLDFAAIARRVAVLAGDRDRGARLFEQNCAVCHTLAGAGGKVGPVLDGIGTRPLDEVLLSMLDPSRNVEANYQMWVARTFDERIFAGRLLSETRTSIELIDSAATTHVLEREEVEYISPSALSLMPSGFESLGEQALADLLELLRSGPARK